MKARAYTSQTLVNSLIASEDRTAVAGVWPRPYSSPLFSPIHASQVPRIVIGWVNGLSLSLTAVAVFGWYTSRLFLATVSCEGDFVDTCPNQSETHLPNTLSAKRRRKQTVMAACASWPLPPCQTLSGRFNTGGESRYLLTVFETKSV